MARKRLTDDELRQRTPQQVAETLKKRRVRDRKRAAAAALAPRLAVVATLPARAATTAPATVDHQVEVLYTTVKGLMEAAGRWNDGMPGLVRTYARVSVTIDSTPIDMVAPAAFAAQARLATILDIKGLPAARRLTKASEAARFLAW